jgi:hypothetical protein
MVGLWNSIYFLVSYSLLSLFSITSVPSYVMLCTIRYEGRGLGDRVALALRGL